jgi:hypothetical protein
MTLKNRLERFHLPSFLGLMLAGKFSQEHAFLCLTEIGSCLKYWTKVETVCQGETRKLILKKFL